MTFSTSIIAEEASVSRNSAGLAPEIEIGRSVGVSILPLVEFFEAGVTEFKTASCCVFRGRSTTSAPRATQVSVRRNPHLSKWYAHVALALFFAIVRFLLLLVVP